MITLRKVDDRIEYTREVVKRFIGGLSRRNNSFTIQLTGEIASASSPLVEQLTTSDEFTKGGIDLNSALLDLQIKRDGNGVPLPIFNQPPDLLMNIQGFLPVIINVTPVNVPLLLGLADTTDPESDFGFIFDLDPSDRKARFEYETFEEVSMLN